MIIIKNMVVYNHVKKQKIKQEKKGNEKMKKFSQAFFGPGRMLLFL